LFRPSAYKRLLRLTSRNFSLSSTYVTFTTSNLTFLELNSLKSSLCSLYPLPGMALVIFASNLINSLSELPFMTFCNQCLLHHLYCLIKLPLFPSITLLIFIYSPVGVPLLPPCLASIVPSRPLSPLRRHGSPCLPVDPLLLYTN
jgi:hypothetical protein